MNPLKLYVNESVDTLLMRRPIAFPWTLKGIHGTQSKQTKTLLLNDYYKGLMIHSLS